jgi:hypothetical protein
LLQYFLHSVTKYNPGWDDICMNIGKLDIGWYFRSFARIIHCPCRHYKLPSLENFWRHTVLQCVLKYETGYFPIHPQTVFTFLTNFIWLTAANSFSIALQGGITCYEII